jgi:hypothetical protein
MRSAEVDQALTSGCIQTHGLNFRCACVQVWGAVAAMAKSAENGAALSDTDVNELVGSTGDPRFLSYTYDYLTGS